MVIGVAYRKEIVDMARVISKGITIGNAEVMLKVVVEDVHEFSCVCNLPAHIKIC